ncbi:hypothetical protein KAR91_81220 [Candidatus Pacearchaeota archaeon]|nr:hypothetical protein [Candidatus Pacearchaeota archaeon]
MCLKGNEYQCAICKEVFEKGCSDEDAMAEAKENFGDDVSEEELEEICDYCYKQMFS